MKNRWLDVSGRLVELEAGLPHLWPEELPEKVDHVFWATAGRLEIQHRSVIDELVTIAVTTGVWPAMSPLSGWLIQRRLEWGIQVIAAKVMDYCVEPPVEVSDNEVLLWALVATWGSDGIYAMQNQTLKHAPRG